MSAKLWNGEIRTIKLQYDFATHGGAVGTIALGNLPDGFVIQNLVAKIDTALVGGGSFVVGQDGGGDADGYFTDLDAAVVSTAIRGTGALVWAAPATPGEIGNDLIDIVAAATDGVLVTIATTAYTVGKISFYFTGFQS